MKKFFIFISMALLINVCVFSQTWTEQANDLTNVTFTVIQSVQRFEKLLEQYANFYAYYSVLYLPIEQIETIVPKGKQIISGEKPDTTTGLFLMMTTIRSDAPKLQADFLKSLGVEHSPYLFRLDPEKGGFVVVFYNDPNMESITGGMRTFTNYGTMFKFYKSIF